MCDLNFSEEKTVTGAPELLCKTLYAWEAAISPHLAAEREHATVEDSVVLKMVEQEMECGSKANVLCLVETAGGVASPGPSGTLQCDLYRLTLYLLLLRRLIITKISMYMFLLLLEPHRSYSSAVCYHSDS